VISEFNDPLKGGGKALTPIGRRNNLPRELTEQTSVSCKKNQNEIKNLSKVEGVADSEGTNFTRHGPARSMNLPKHKNKQETKETPEKERDSLGGRWGLTPFGERSIPSCKGTKF